MKSLGSIRRDFAPWNDPNAKPYIQFENVTKRFGDFTAVNNLSLTIFEREFFALLGASGCGKSTLLRMLAGFEEPTAGRILLDGQDLRGIPPYRRPVNMMFQSYALFPHMTVEKNIAFGLKQEGMPKPEIDERVAEMLKLVKLEQFAKRKPHQLSGGQRQRVALARSVAKRPKVLLLDEPLGALDKKLREETQFELMDLQQNLGLTFVVVTHDQEEAMTMADRIAIMDKGEVMQVATPAEVYEAPGSRFVADFVGNVNMFEGKVARARRPTPRASPARSGAEIVVENAGDAAAGTDVAFAIRPEKIKVSSKTPADAVNAHGGRGLRHRLSRRHDRLPRQAGRRAGGQGKRAERGARHRGSADLERPGLGFLPAGCRRRADTVGGGHVERCRRISRRRRPTAAKPFAGAGSVPAFVSRLVIIVPYLWLLFFFLVPFIIVFKISLSQTAIAMPPYTPVLDFRDGISGFFAGFGELSFDNYVWLTAGRALLQRLCVERHHRRRSRPS